MTYKEVKDLLEGVAADLHATVQFDHGRRSDWNVKGKKFPAINLEPFTATSTFTPNNGQLNDTYAIRMVFYTQSKTDANLDQLMNDLSMVDKLRRDFIVKLNQEDNVALSGINMQPFFKVLDDSLTGQILTFNLTVPDTYKYCC